MRGVFRDALLFELLCLLGQGSLDDVTQGDAEIGEVIGIGVVDGQGGGQTVDDGVGDVLAVAIVAVGAVDRFDA